MTYTYITVEIQDRICTISLNRPDKRNAFNDVFVDDLKSAFAHAERNDDIKVIILKANGEVFSAGADLGFLKKLQQNDLQQNIDDSKSLMLLYKMIYQLPKPVIAQVEGHAIAGGCGLVTVCDYAYSVPEAKFGYTEVRIGFIPAIVMIFLLRKLGETSVKDLLLSGRLLSAEEANSMGLITKISSSETISSDVQKLAQSLVTKCSGQAMATTKTMIAAVQDMSLNEALDFAAEQNAHARETTDCKRGIGAFLAKEKISW